VTRRYSPTVRIPPPSITATSHYRTLIEQQNM